MPASRDRWGARSFAEYNKYSVEQTLEDLFRLYAFRLSLALLVGMIASCLLLMRELSIDVGHLDRGARLLPLLLVAVLCDHMHRQRASTMKWLWRRLSLILFVFGYVAVFSYTAIALQDLTVAIGFRVVDALLTKADVFIGFHWGAVYQLLMQHDWQRAMLQAAYQSYGYQVGVVLVILSLRRAVDDLGEYLFLFTFVAAVAIAIATLVPASNAYYQFGVASHGDPTPWSQFFGFRDGTLNVIDLADNQGLISFPSVHAAHAVVFAYALRHVKYLNVAALILNAVMIVSAVPYGGHYLVDILAGLALGAGLIAISRTWVTRPYPWSRSMAVDALATRQREFRA